MLEGELPPLDARKRPRTGLLGRRGDGQRRTMRIKVTRRLRDGSEPSPEIVRNRTILQEMRRAYNLLTGVGDGLVDLRLAQVMSHKDGIGTLGKQDLCALNYDLAKLAALIFGPKLAQTVYEHIGGFITERF